MKRSRVVVGSLAGAVAIHLSFVACSAMRTDDASADVTMTDVVGDAVQAIVDAEVHDANAQDAGPVGPMQAACVDVPSDGGLTTHVATFNVASFDPQRTDVSARVCGYDAGAIFGVPGATCQQAAVVLFRAGRIDVVCGQATTALLWVR